MLPGPPCGAASRPADTDVELINIAVRAPWDPDGLKHLTFESFSPWEGEKDSKIGRNSDSKIGRD